MIMINSKAGQRLAKAKRLLDEHEAYCLNSPSNAQYDADLDGLILDYEKAADALANELIAGRHHEAEGD